MNGGTGDSHFLSWTVLVRRRWRLIASITFVGGVLAGAVAFLMPPRYTAEAQLLQETQYLDGVAVPDPAAVDTLVEMLVSPRQLKKLAADLGTIKATSGLDLPDYSQLQDHLLAFRESHSRLVAITFVSTNPRLATIVVNQAVKVYLSDASKRLQTDQTAALASVSERLATARRDLDHAVERLSTFRLSNGISKTDSAGEIDVKIGQLNQQLAIGRAELAAKEALLKKNASINVGAVQIATVSGDFPVEGQTAFSSGGGSTATSSEPISIQRLTIERDSAKARLSEIQARLQTLRAAADSAEPKQVLQRELEQKVIAATAVFQGLTQREADMMSRGPENLPARLVTLATIPTRPSSPNPFLFLLPAVLGSALLSGMIALVRERADQRLRSERDVEEALQVPCIGLVPKRRNRPGDRLLDILLQQPFSAYVEAVRAVSVAANKHIRLDELPNSFLFTGSANGDGTTTLAVSFAVYAARLNQRVLLMDLNFRRPGIAAALDEPECPDSAGISKGQPLKGAIHKIKSLGIDYLPTPQHHQFDPLALLLSDGFSELMARVVRDYDCVVIDSAPVTDATETRLLASIVDRILLVVKWGATDVQAAQSAIRGLQTREGEAPISVVVTQADMRVHVRRRYGLTSAASATAQIPVA